MFAVAALSLAAAVAWFGVPDWLPLPRPVFAQAQADLQLNFPARRQDRKPLPDGTEFFSVSGTISNIGQQTRAVPSLLVVLRDKRERIVYEKGTGAAQGEAGPWRGDDRQRSADRHPPRIRRRRNRLEARLTGHPAAAAPRANNVATCACSPPIPLLRARSYHGADRKGPV
ncbi:hypothetical protein ACFSTD_22980 [Novosphingobium colocasiae]